MRTWTILAFAVSLAVQVGVPLVVAIHHRRRTRAPWELFVYGALVFALFQLFTWLPLSEYLDSSVGESVTPGLGAFFWLLAKTLTTSLVEELGRWWGYRHLFPRKAFRMTWRNGVMFGLGHGSLETMLLVAGLTFVHLLVYVALAGQDLGSLLPAETTQSGDALRVSLQSALDTSWSQPLIVALERVLMLPHQIAWSLLVMTGLVHHQRRWLWYSVMYHASVAVIVQHLAKLSGFYVAESVNLGLALFSLWLVSRLRSVTEWSV